MKPTEAEIAALAKKAAADDEALAALVAGLSSKDLDSKRRSFQSLHLLIKTNPGRLYPRYWDRFAVFLDSPGVDAKYIGIYLLAGLAAVDTEDWFEDIFNKYFSLLDDNTLIAPMHVALNAATVFKAKPDLRDDIVKLLTSIDRTHHTPGRKALIASAALESLDKVYDEIEDKQAVLDFARFYVNAPSPKARKVAKDFLKRREKPAA
ncbi:hypothetical protein [Dehalogenimonas etheniformans]|uniref:HEAT repeat domain-containing protein n=1 Tax=Dehalogenimonas etheniformans TaxID=1536648 RepID=A0A2P5P7B0_9CHLR|nr:hypothetical protein [Dehalogenimonas etheniformans]PPD58182.1 hypothetical protein JP09_005160 [Dehalogenimonas etheniformans]QNT75592.1 hypothetical protein HX448_02260 [Dehalogenimonas etheniformans]